MNTDCIKSEDLLFKPNYTWIIIVVVAVIVLCYCRKKDCTTPCKAEETV